MGIPNERVVAGATRMPPMRWSGDETNFRRCLYKSDLVSRKYCQRCNAGPRWVLSIRRTSGFPRPLCPFSEWPLETKLKRGSIFIRRFLMKHFKCMEPTVVPIPDLAAFTLATVPLTQSPSSSDRDSPSALSPACLTLKRYESFPSALPCATHVHPACP